MQKRNKFAEKINKLKSLWTEYTMIREPRLRASWARRHVCQYGWNAVAHNQAVGHFDARWRIRHFPINARREGDWRPSVCSISVRTRRLSRRQCVPRPASHGCRAARFFIGSSRAADFTRRCTLSNRTEYMEQQRNLCRWVTALCRMQYLIITFVMNLVHYLSFVK